MSWLLGCGDPVGGRTPNPRTARVGYDTISETLNIAPPIVDDQPTTWRELVEGIASARNAPRPIRLPGWTLRAAAPYAGRMMTGVNMRVSNAKAKRELGWTPRYPTFREGLAES
jgi:nucleoside-diphosphate-sugar epimerase